MEKFLSDVLAGLNSKPKYLQSKYFYDAAGDRLFQKIMQSDDYYLTNCEMEILENQKEEIAGNICRISSRVDVVEFGPGDAVKSIHLIRELNTQQCIGKYFPIDISGNIIQLLEKKFSSEIPNLTLRGFEGEYFAQLWEVNQISSHRKLVIFLGGNIGNYLPENMMKICRQLNEGLAVGDLALIGFDLKKDPATILAAYNDHEGWTAKFNLNLLERINRELDADFDVAAFKHFSTYDPIAGACKSYLISRREQDIHLSDNTIHFIKNEPIFMEVSQKYRPEEIATAARESGFEQLEVFTDKRSFFADVLWQKKKDIP